MDQLVLTDDDKKMFINQLKKAQNGESKNFVIGQTLFNIKKNNDAIYVSGEQNKLYKSYIIQPGEITNLSLKGGRRRRVRKTQRRKSTKRRHTRRYRRK